MTPMPGPESLGHGIHLIPVPLPFEMPPWVNCYAIESGGGITLIDCGTDWQPGHDALKAGLKALGLGGAQIHTLIVSHLHPDHVGMASRLVSEHGCRFVMHRRAATRVTRYNDTPGQIRRNRDLSIRHGVPASATEELADVGPRPAYMPFIDSPDVVVDDGELLELDGSRRLEVLHTPGHEASHICLRDSLTGVVFTGDHVLPRITPVVMFDEDYDDVLADFLTSLRRLLAVPIGLTYPAHGSIIERGAQRVEQIILHHERRLAQMWSRTEQAPLTAWELMGAVFRPHLTPIQQRLALRETVAHLEHLRIGGRISTDERDGVVWYRV